MSVTGFPFLSWTVNLNCVATPDFSGPGGCCQIIFVPSEVWAVVEFAAAEAGVSAGPDQSESSVPGQHPALQSFICGKSNSPTSVHGNPRRSTISAKIW